MKDQSSITKLKKIAGFKEAINALLRKDPLTPSQEGLLLSSAVVLIDNYSADARNRQSIEMAYWILLNYSLNSRNMQPLYDFAFDFGLYPICKAISTHSNNDRSLADELALQSIDELFSEKSVVSTLEQSNRGRSFRQHATGDVAYIAPTSFGKTRQLLDLALSDLSGDRPCIVVPTKALLSQTRNDVKELGASFKLITHDEMYEGEARFVAVLTQERAMRLLESNPDLNYSSLFVDEAHRLFDKGSRALLLSRLIRESRKRNQDMPVAFLSPVVSDVSYFSAISGRSVEELRIRFNMKEPRYLHLGFDGSFRAYNRFFDEYEHIGRYEDVWDCVSDRASDKNLIYLGTPQAIQNAARSLARRLPAIELTPEFSKVITCLSEHIHEEYDEIECLRHGVVYLHGKMPDGIRDYLVSKVSELHQIRFIVANTVILEGVNLPIDSIFILSSINLNKTSLINLVGRASRLNRVFCEPSNLKMLRPEIVFVDSDWNAKNRRMESFIKTIRSSLFKDEIGNPLIKRGKGQAISPEEETVVASEDYMIEDHDNDYDRFKALLYQMGFGSVYYMDDLVINMIYNRLSEAAVSQEDELLEVIRAVFIDGLDSRIRDHEILRLKNDKVRSYYSRFLSDRNTLPLNQRIAQSIGVFRARKESNRPLMYIGRSFGEVSSTGTTEGERVYVDLSNKSVREMVSLVLVKLKIEEDFLSYKVVRFVRLLHRYNLISNKTYNDYVYGTNEHFKIQLVRAGLPLPLVNLLSQHNQLGNIRVDQYGNLAGNSLLLEFGSRMDDFVQFEIENYAM